MPPSPKSNLPAFRDLTVQQVAYCMAFVENGGQGKAAAEAAGYTSPGTESWRLLQNPAISRAIYELQAHEFKKLTGRGLRLVGLILDHGIRTVEAGGKPTAVHLEAAKVTFDRAGHVAKTKEKQEDNGQKRLEDMTAEELRGFIDRAKGRLSDEIEATAVDITPAGNNDPPQDA